MRILHLTTFLQGGAGLAIARLASAQAAAGHDVALVTSKTGAPGYGNYPQHLVALADAGVPCHAVDSLFARTVDANDAVRRFLRQWMAAGGAPAIVHAHAAVPARVGADAMADHGGASRVLQTMHGWGIAKSSEQASADVRVMNALALVVVPSRAAATQMKALGLDAARTRIIPYGVEAAPAVGRVGPLSTAGLGVPPTCTIGAPGVLACIGTIGARKNQRLLVDALATIPATRRPVCLFVGDGDADALMARAVAQGVDGWVRCLGQRADARAIAGAADWLVLPSRSEGLPLSVLEAFADRVPVIVSDIPELAELVDDGVHGLLFRTESAASLAAVLGRALVMPPQARRNLTEAAWRRYRAHHRIEAMVRAYDRAYGDVLGGRVTPCAA